MKLDRCPICPMKPSTGLPQTPDRSHILGLAMNSRTKVAIDQPSIGAPSSAFASCFTVVDTTLGRSLCVYRVESSMDTESTIKDILNNIPR